ncbi:hypothetical protein SAMN05421796_10139 [Chryseobacterium piscicola]|uniref:Uncharacterized protein n=1 Tax=Chryseobacterium piscicola TaxID=551459 RepID=A0A1N7JMZ7_9FLAO|nr:hypothetical protein [Chryseobacterium piscicola]PQA91368.1 hypothetical protein B0A70_12945 [Chryseobacterium piscicola]SIS50708.1 hypothetical protein SAMN05421796_10139 [Chryseobacterium piscicola]
MKLKLLIAALILNFCFYFGQKIEILNIEKTVENESTHYILYCELINNSSEEIILPLPTDHPGKLNPNEYNYFYNIEVSPKNSIDQWEVPPYQLQEIRKLHIEDFVIAKPKQKVKFQINTEYIIFYNRRFNQDISPKTIKLIYQPGKIDKAKNLSSELQDLKIYSQKIISKKYKF